MTRINCIPVQELSQKHLVIEYRELPRIFGKARRVDSRENVPKQYQLGPGHMKFFYDKLIYLIVRQKQLVDEMKRRGYNPTFNAESLQEKYGYLPLELWQDWIPNKEDRERNRVRLRERGAGITEYPPEE